MRLLKKNIDDHGVGSVRIVCNEPEDLWHAFNLLQPSDVIAAPTVRRVVHESATGSTSSSRVRTTLAVQVAKSDFESEGPCVRISGPIVEENKAARLGAFHTLSIEVEKPFTLTKPLWDEIALKQLATACDPGATAEIGAVVLQEGLANVCLLTEHLTLVRQRIEVSIPRKRRGTSTDYDKGIVRFFDTLSAAVEAHFDPEKLQAIVLAGPGLMPQNFLRHFIARAVQTEKSSLVRAKSKFVAVHASSGHVYALNQALKAPEVTEKISKTRWARQQRVLDDFQSMLNTDEDRAWYGRKEVEAAAAQGAVSILLLSDELFRGASVAERRALAALQSQVKEQGGETLVFSSMHDSGRQLGVLGGIAALLTYPLADLDEAEPV